jgi:hypothetical protein
MATHCNTTCAICVTAHNGINGRYCDILGRYVEYDKEPPCRTTQQQYESARQRMINQNNK